MENMQEWIDRNVREIQAQMATAADASAPVAEFTRHAALEELSARLEDAEPGDRYYFPRPIYNHVQSLIRGELPPDVPEPAPQPFPDSETLAKMTPAQAWDRFVGSQTPEEFMEEARKRYKWISPVAAAAWLVACSEKTVEAEALGRRRVTYLLVRHIMAHPKSNPEGAADAGGLVIPDALTQEVMLRLERAAADSQYQAGKETDTLKRNAWLEAFQGYTRTLRKLTDAINEQRPKG